MNSEVHSQLKSKFAAFKLNDSERSKKSIHNLCRAIRNVNGKFWTKLQSQDNDTNTQIVARLAK